MPNTMAPHILPTDGRYHFTAKQITINLPSQIILCGKVMRKLTAEVRQWRADWK